MKTIIVIIALIHSFWSMCQTDTIAANNLSDTSQTKNCNCYSIDHYLVNYGSVLEGTVIKLKRNKFKIKIENSYKGKKQYLLNKRVTVHFQQYPMEETENRNDKYKLELNRKYLFIVGNTRWKISTLILRSPYTRFIVQNDSLFIPIEVLNAIEFPQNIDVSQKNTFNDPLQKNGLKISVNDFQELSVALNANYKKINKQIVKVENSKEYSDPVILSILNYRKKFYK